nr:hypothetical protein [Microvirga sp.]
MTRQSFSEDEFAENMTLQNVSANIETIKRMKGWSVMEMSKHIGISDRHLDSLLKMNSNVTVLVLEKIADARHVCEGGIDIENARARLVQIRGGDDNRFVDSFDDCSECRQIERRQLAGRVVLGVSVRGLQS